MQATTRRNTVSAHTNKKTRALKKHTQAHTYVHENCEQKNKQGGTLFPQSTRKQNTLRTLSRERNTLLAAYMAPQQRHYQYHTRKPRLM